MRVVNLYDFSENRFVAILEKLIETSSDKNKDWFPVLIKNYKQYCDWFFVLGPQDQFIAFSTIQAYQPRCFRLLTRCYIVPEFRRAVLPKFDKEMSPGSYMVKAQLEYLNHKYDSVFISLEHIRRRAAIMRMAKKIHFSTGLEWHAAEGMYLTCSNVLSCKCWQNICYSGDMPPLRTITYGEWLELYGK